jgi:DNA-binding LacI/PurR family transcriptional regulator
MGYRKGIEKNGLGFSHIFEASKFFNKEDGIAAVDEFFADSIKPDAIICDSHSIALGVILRLREKGLTIPKDVGLIGHGANIDDQVITPSMTAIVQPEEQIAEKAFDLLIELINKDLISSNQTITIPAEIVLRESC